MVFRLNFRHLLDTMPRVHSVYKSSEISAVSLTNYNTIYS
jgi:hypothetical protein